MIHLYLIGGIASFLISFFVHKYFIQFLILGLFLVVLHLLSKNSKEIAELKQTIKDHNELIKQDIGELKKQNR
ncbi:MAG: hypothetical protein AB1668_07065 [Nanoarchaeota archaeon]